MIITKVEIIDDKNLIGHMVIDGASSYPDVINEIVANDEAEILMTVNGRDIDIAAFTAHWQSQINEMIIKEAKRMVDEKFESVRDKMDEVTSALDGAIHALIPDDRD